MKKAYSLDYEIERDVDRCQAVYDILDSLDKTPSNLELEQMASYILYGKDEEGQNAVQRGEMTDGDKRYGTFKRADDKLLSLDEILENPLADHQQIQTLNHPYVYTKPKPTITKPKYDKKTGERIDPGDSDIPGMQDLWESIARYEHVVAVNEGKVPPDEHTPILKDGYRLYQLKHQLVEMRRQQYYLKDIFKPTLHFLSTDHPRTQYYDWNSDAQYWMPLDKWQERVSHALLHTISTNLDDYETRTNPWTGETEVLWVVRKHTFDWENPSHIKALINYYDALYDQLHERHEAVGNTFFFDFERYRAMANLSEVRNFILDQKLIKVPYAEIVHNLQVKYGLKYNENYLCNILAKEIPEKIALAAQKHRLLIETPAEDCKQCFTCGRLLPRHKLFFVCNRSRKDGFSSNCKECERNKRIEQGGQNANDQRNKESQMHKVQSRET